MQDKPPSGLSWRFAPRLTQLVAVGWVTIVALLFLVRYGGWQVPETIALLIHSALTTFAVGSHFGEFWRAGLADAGCVVAIVATAFAAGAVAIERLIPEKNLWSALFSLAAGLWILSLAALVVGFFSTSWLPLVLLLAGCWLLPAPRRFFVASRAAAREKLDGWEKFMLACLAVAALLSLPGAMAPVFDYDSLEYHLGAPAEYLKAGRIIALPHNFYSNLPQLTEMLYLLALRLSSGSAAKILHWSFGLGTAGVVYALATRWWTRRIGLTAAALFYCLPFVGSLSAMANIDLATAFYAGLAFGAGLLWVEQDAVRSGNAPATNPRLLWLAALAAGMAVATKWTAVAVVLLPLAVLLAGTAKPLRVLPVFCLLAAVPVLPWVAKNWLLMDNPVYPMFNGLFHSPYWSAGQAAVFAEKHYAHFGGEGWRQLGSLIVQVLVQFVLGDRSAALAVNDRPAASVVEGRAGQRAPCRRLVRAGVCGLVFTDVPAVALSVSEFRAGSNRRRGRDRGAGPAGANGGRGDDAGGTDLAGGPLFHRHGRRCSRARPGRFI